MFYCKSYNSAKARCLVGKSLRHDTYCSTKFPAFKSIQENALLYYHENGEICYFRFGGTVALCQWQNICNGWMQYAHWRLWWFEALISLQHFITLYQTKMTWKWVILCSLAEIESDTGSHQIITQTRKGKNKLVSMSRSHYSHSIMLCPCMWRCHRRHNEHWTQHLENTRFFVVNLKYTRVRRKIMRVTQQ